MRVGCLASYKHPGLVLLVTLLTSGCAGPVKTESPLPNSPMKLTFETNRKDSPLLLISGDHTLDCDAQDGNECWVPLVLTKEAGADCVVTWVFRYVEVQKNKKVVWYLNKIGDYEFRADDGIDITNNDAFESNGHNNSKKHQYTWKAKNENGRKERNYNIKVFHVPSDTPCRVDDPVIINRG